MKQLTLKRIGIRPITVMYAYEIYNIIVFWNKVTFDLDFFAMYIYKTLVNMKISEWISRDDIEFLLYKFVSRNCDEIKEYIPTTRIILNHSSYYEVVDRLSETEKFDTKYRNEDEVLRLLNINK